MSHNNSWVSHYVFKGRKIDDYSELSEYVVQRFRENTNTRGLMEEMRTRHGKPMAGQRPRAERQVNPTQRRNRPSQKGKLPIIKQ